MSNSNRPGYFLLAQQISALRDNMDLKFESARKENDAKFSAIHDEINNLQRWAFGLIVTVIVGFIAIYFK